MKQNPAWRVGEELMNLSAENPENHKIGRQVAGFLILGAVILCGAFRLAGSSQEKDQSVNSAPQTAEAPVPANE